MSTGCCEAEADDNFNAVFAALKEDVEASLAGRAKLCVKQYSGTGGIHVVCQEAFHHNFDLTHEHWSEIIEPCDEQRDSGEAFLRRKCRLAFVHLLLTGDKAAGKTTFLNGLTTGELRILQCLRYESALFYNIWYAPSVADLEDLRTSLSKRALPFFQTELAHGAMLMDAPELRFFLEDEEFGDGGPVSPATAGILESAQHVMVKILELGGDCLHELLELKREEAATDDGSVVCHPVKAALLQQTAATVRMAARVAYFVNLGSLLTSGEPESIDNTADACGPAVLVERLEFLCHMLREDAQVTCFCTRPPVLEHATAVALVCQALSLSSADSHDLARHCDARETREVCTPVGCDGGLGAGVWVQLQIVHWLATRRAGLTPSRVRVIAVEHLCGDGLTDHTAVLRSLRGLLGGNALSTTESALPLLSEQVAHLLLDGAVACVDKDTVADLLQPFEDSGHADLYRNVVHPMVVVPSMVILDSFSAIMADLTARGLACPADDQGQISLEVRIISNTRTLQFRQRCRRLETEAAPACEADGHGEGPDEEALCWRFVVEKEVVAEARNALNLFQLKGAPPPVPHDAAVRILAGAWKTAMAANFTASSADAFSELFLAARFLLLNGHNMLQGTWACRWAADAGYSGDAEEDQSSSMLLQVPPDLFSELLPRLPSSEVIVASGSHTDSDHKAPASKKSRRE